MTSVFSWQNCQPLTYFVLYFKAKFACYSRYLLTSYFCTPVPYIEKHIFFSSRWSCQVFIEPLDGQLDGVRRCQIQTVLQVFIEPFKFSFFSITGRGIDLDYCDLEWFALETNRDHSVVFEIASKYCISDSFVDCDGYYISSKGFLPTVLDIMVILVKFTHSSPLQFTDA